MPMQALDQSSPSFKLAPRNYYQYNSIFTDAVSNGHEVFIDDAIPATPSMKMFFLELRHKLPGLIPVFIGPTVVRPTVTSNYNVYAGFRVAYDNAPDLPVGKVSVTIHADNKAVYFVESESIHNDRYRRSNLQHKIRSSTNFKTAVKVGVEHLKPICPRNLASEYTSNLYSAKMSVVRPAVEKMNKVVHMSESDLFKELLNLQRTGYTPVTQAMSAAFKVIEAEGEELYATSKYDPRTAFVWIRSTDATVHTREEGVQVFKSFDEFPEHIRNKLMVLQIAESNATIKDVGHKIDDTKYWVFL